MKSGFSASTILLKNRVVLRSEQCLNSESITSRHRELTPFAKCISATLQPSKNISSILLKKKEKNPHHDNLELQIKSKTECKPGES